MYFISKFLPLLLMPLGISIILSIFLSIKKRRFIFLLIPAILSVFSNGIISEYLWRYVESPWKRLSIQEMPRADAIVVLSQGRHIPPGESDIIEWANDPDRFVSGLMLLKADKAPKIIFTGGFSPFYKELPPEGDLYKSEAITFGVSSEKILITNPARNTLEESIAVKALLKENNYPTILLVTSAFHMHRAKRLFEKQTIKVIAYPVDFKSSKFFNKQKIINPYNLLPNSNKLYSNSSAIREILGRIIYRFF